MDEVKYEYKFSISDSKVLEESLYYTPKTRITRIFEKELRKDYEFSDTDSFKKSIAKRTRSNMLFLSKAINENWTELDKVVKFFREINYMPTNSNIEKILQISIKELYNNANKRKLCLKILKKLDLGVVDIAIDKTKQNVKALDFNFNGVDLKSRVSKEVEDFYDLRLIREVNGKKIGMHLSNESDGTRKIIALFIPILNILKSNLILVIDEIENSFHPEFIRLILDLFHKANKKSQLIFSTHNTAILNTEIFRKDQIKFTEKIDNCSEVFSLAEIKEVREGRSDYERQYLNGKFGAIPKINENIIQIIKEWPISR